MWSFRLGPVPGASGSAYVETDCVKVLAVANGPKEYSAYTGGDEFLRHSQATIELTVEPANSFLQPLTTALESTILVQKYQKSVIEVKVTVLEGDETDTLAYALVAASLAAVDAGIEVRDTMTASTAYLENGVVTLNKHSTEATASLTLGYLPNLREAVVLQQVGRVSPSEFVQLLQVAEAGCTAFFQLLRSKLRQD